MESEARPGAEEVFNERQLRMVGSGSRAPLPYSGGVRREEPNAYDVAHHLHRRLRRLSETHCASVSVIQHFDDDERRVGQAVVANVVTSPREPSDCERKCSRSRALLSG